jgi:hypothetical protein
MVIHDFMSFDKITYICEIIEPVQYYIISGSKSNNTASLAKPSNDKIVLLTYFYTVILIFLYSDINIHDLHDLNYLII